MAAGFVDLVSAETLTSERIASVPLVIRKVMNFVNLILIPTWLVFMYIKITLYEYMIVLP